MHEVALIGCPNVGKSSLFNTLLSQHRAIVADVEGTTRDYVSADMEMAGLKIRLVDTAGLTENPADIQAELTSEIEAAAQALSWEIIGRARLLLFCLDQSRSLNDLERSVLERLDHSRTLLIGTKQDLGKSEKFPITPAAECCTLPGRLAGIDGLWAKICSQLETIGTEEVSIVGSTIIRCEEHIGSVQTSISGAIQAARVGAGDEIIAAELRIALEFLGRITGTVYTDDILDQVFGRFCIGK